VTKIKLRLYRYEVSLTKDKALFEKQDGEKGVLNMT
jgi:hypothetical protein